MNTKHLACLLLFAVVIGLLQGTSMLNKKKEAADEAHEFAKRSYEAATAERIQTQKNLDKKRHVTAALRKYLEMWRPKLEQSGTENNAKNEFQRLLKKFPTLVTFNNSTSAPAENKDMSYVNRRIASNVKLEGDAEKAISLLASVERDLATSRISNLEIRKGQRGNDVELTISVETPLLPTATPAK
jgi:prefoldin subunit 5